MNYFEDFQLCIKNDKRNFYFIFIEYDDVFYKNMFMIYETYNN